MAPTHEESRGPRADRGSRLQRAIVLALLRDEGGHRWSYAQLCVELGAPAPAVEQAVRRLLEEGVLRGAGQEVWASGAARRLDELGLIGI